MSIYHYVSELVIERARANMRRALEPFPETGERLYVPEAKMDNDDIYTKFMKCMDQAKMNYVGVIEHVAMNTLTLHHLLEAMHFPPEKVTSGVQTLYGAHVKVDDELPDEAFKINELHYSDGKVKCRTCHKDAENTILGECQNCALKLPKRALHLSQEILELHESNMRSRQVFMRPPVTFTDIQKRGIQEAIEREIGDSARDTHFARSAKLLLKELLDDILDEYGFVDRSHYENGEMASAETIIAQRIYDLVCFIVPSVTSWQLAHNGTLTPAQVVRILPDLTEWPDGNK